MSSESVENAHKLSELFLHNTKNIPLAKRRRSFNLRFAIWLRTNLIWSGQIITPDDC